MIKSLLQGAGIPFNTRGEGLMNLFPSDLLGRVMSRPGAEVSFDVPESLAEEARQLLTEIADEAPEPPADETEGEP